MISYPMALTMCGDSAQASNGRVVVTGTNPYEFELGSWGPDTGVTLTYQVLFPRECCCAEGHVAGNSTG